MTNWFTVMVFELRQQFRRKAYLIVTFVLPIVALVAFFGYQAYRDSTATESETVRDPISGTVNSSRGADVGVVDLTPDGLFPSPESYPSAKCTVDEAEAVAFASEGLAATRARVIKRVSSPYCLHIYLQTVDSVDAGKTMVKDGDLDVLYVIEPDFATTGDISVYVVGFNPDALESDPLIKDFILRSLLYEVPNADYEAVYLRLRDPAFIGVHKLTVDGVAQQNNEDRNIILIYAFGMTTIMSVFWGGGYLMQSVVQEKESRIVEIVLSSVQPMALLTGKIVGMALVSIGQLITWVVVLVFIMSQAGDLVSALDGVEITVGMMGLLFVYFLLGFMLVGSLMAAIGAFSTAVREAQNFVVFITLPSMIPMFFLPLFVEEPDATLPTVLSLVPFTAPLSMVMRVVVSDVPVEQIVLSLALLAASVLGALWLAGRFFRVNTLLSGTMPKLRDIPKLILG